MQIQKRLAAVITGILVVVFQDGLGLTEQSTLEIVGLIMALVLGDSVREIKKKDKPS